MKRAALLLGGLAALLVLLALFGMAQHDSTIFSTVHLLQGTPAATIAAAAEIPGDTQTIEFDQPITEGLDANHAIRFYQFRGEAGQLVRLSVEPKTGNFYTTITILSGDLEAVIGGTLGENLISGAVVVRLPADGRYVVTVEYADTMIGTPLPGIYELVLSAAKPKP
ncbi:MAG: hypothetical protein IT324_18565 [Anaerolineae bacterium]|nr:hypothetical protein [Anaerolineae bacterium]